MSRWFWFTVAFVVVGMAVDERDKRKWRREVERQIQTEQKTAK